MPIDTTPSTVATSALQSLPFESLIGGPLDAAIKAEAKAAETSWTFIEKVGLQEVNGQKKAVTVDFIYNSNGREVKLIVPLLAIVPIPYIAVDCITIDFKANIAASSSVSQEDTTSENIDAGGDGRASIGFGPFSLDVNFHASYSSKKDSKATQDSKYSVEYTMDVHVGASQADMPAGLAAVLNILQSSITPTIPHANLQVSPKSINIDPTKEASYTINIVAFDNRGLRQSRDLTITLDSAASGITIDTLTSPQIKGTASATTITVTTDKDGSATVTIKVHPPSSNPTQTISAQSLNFKISGTTNGDDEQVQETVVLNVPQIPGNPAPSRP